LKEENIIVDKTIRERNGGVLEGKSLELISQISNVFKKIKIEKTNTKKIFPPYKWRKFSRSVSTSKAISF
jgi:hypothetical protein